MLDSGSPQSSDPDLTRTLLSTQMTNSDQSPPSRNLAFLAATTSPSNTETTPISAIGQNGWPMRQWKAAGEKGAERHRRTGDELGAARRRAGTPREGRDGRAAFGG